MTQPSEAERLRLLLESEREARIRLEYAQAVTEIALTHLELPELLHELLLRIREILHADTAAVLMLDAAGAELVATAAVGLEEEVERGVRIPVGRGFAGRVAAERRPVILPDVDHADVLNPLLREKGVKSMLGVPLLVDNHVIGIVHVGSLTPRDFTQSDTELLQLVAERAALGIERARIHDEMVRLDRLKLNFVAVASHELRTPATAVYGIALTLHERRDLDPQVRSDLEEALFGQADRLRRLIEQLLDLSRLDSGAIAVAPRPIHVASVVEEVVKAIPGASAVQTHVPQSLAAAADPLVIERVLTNLVGNALRYGSEPVVVSAEQRDRHLRIAVEDSGEGIPKRLVPRLFERFERGDEGHGSGLGLAIAKTYARAHGGDVLYAARTGGGARFELVLPNEHGS